MSIPQLASNPTFAPLSTPSRGASDLKAGSVSSPPRDLTSLGLSPGEASFSGTPFGDKTNSSYDPLSPSPKINNPSQRPYQPLPGSSSIINNGLMSISTYPSASTTVASRKGGSTEMMKIPSDGMVGSVSLAGTTDWEAHFEKERQKKWGEKVSKDMEGWRGGHGTPRSAYPRAAMPNSSYYGQPITGTIGEHLPKEIVRIERDWSGGEVCQFETGFPMELEGRISPNELRIFIESLNDILAQAYSVKGAVIDNLIAIASLWTSLWWKISHFERELQNLERVIEKANRDVFNPKGLNVLSPRDVALQFLEIEYY